MSENTHDVLGGLLIVLLIVLFAGTPDLMDAIIAWVNRH